MPDDNRTHLPGSTVALTTPAAPPPSRTRRWGRWLIIRSVLVAAIVVLLRLTGCMERLFYQPTVGPTPVPTVQFSEAQAVRFKSADGTPLFGWFIPASRLNRPADGMPAPTILHVHGNAGNLADHIWFTEHLPLAGFNLLVFDYRGYGESGGRAIRRHDLIADTHAALDYLLTRRDIDAQCIGLYGQSLGGSIGLNVMADRPEIRAAVIESAFTSWRDEAAFVLGGIDPGWWARGLASLVIPDTHRVDAAMQRIDRPVLLLHGDADTIVPVTHSRRLKAVGADSVRLLELPGGEHNSLRESHPEIDAAVIDFLRAHLERPPSG